MTRDEAEKLSLLYLKIGADLDQSVAFWRDHSEEFRFQEARRATGNIMGTLYADLMAPLWKEFPDLLPRHMDGEYEIPDSCYQPRFYAPAKDKQSTDWPGESTETNKPNKTE